MCIRDRSYGEQKLGFISLGFDVCEKILNRSEGCFIANTRVEYALMELCDSVKCDLDDLTSGQRNAHF